jgi:DNA repair protein RecO (recombination protein O)
VRFFEIRILKLAGFEPALDHCITCRTPVTNGGAYYFYAEAGGIKCAKYARPERYDQSVSAGTVRTLLLGKDMDIDKIKLIVLSDSLALESRKILTGFISHILSREVKSLKVMEQVRKLCL